MSMETLFWSAPWEITSPAKGISIPICWILPLNLMVKALSLAIFSSGPTALIAFSTISLAAPESSARSGQIKARTKLHEKRCQRILHMIHLQDCTGPTIRENCKFIIMVGWEKGPATCIELQKQSAVGQLCRLPHFSAQARIG